MDVACQVGLSGARNQFRGVAVYSIYVFSEVAGSQEHGRFQARIDTSFGYPAESQYSLVEWEMILSDRCQRGARAGLGALLGIAHWTTATRLHESPMARGVP